MDAAGGWVKLMLHGFGIAFFWCLEGGPGDNSGMFQKKLALWYQRLQHLHGEHREEVLEANPKPTRGKSVQ